MRTRTLTALTAAALAVAVPVAAAQGAPGAGAAPHAAKKKADVAYALDGPGMSLAAVAGQEGRYTLTHRLWSRKQKVAWFTPGPPPAIGSVSVTTFAALLAKRATGDGASAPVADISWVDGGRTRHFLATVATAAGGLGSAKAPALRATLSDMTPERLQAIADGREMSLLKKAAVDQMKNGPLPSHALNAHPTTHRPHSGTAIPAGHPAPPRVLNGTTPADCLIYGCPGGVIRFFP